MWWGGLWGWDGRNIGLQYRLLVGRRFLVRDRFLDSLLLLERSLLSVGHEICKRRGLRRRTSRLGTRHELLEWSRLEDLRGGGHRLLNLGFRDLAVAVAEAPCECRP